MLSHRLVNGISRLSRHLTTLSINTTSFVPQPECISTPKLSFNDLSWNVKKTNSFRSQIISVEINAPWREQINNLKIENPISNATIETPLQPNQCEIVDQNSNKIQEFEMPPIENRIGEDGIQAAVLIGIRRRKMRRHKLKRLRKKMKFEWAKKRQRRELRKEKAFQAVLISQIKEAEKFSAEQYVADKLKQANETPIPKYWKGKRLPEFIVKEKMGIK